MNEYCVVYEDEYGEIGTEIVDAANSFAAILLFEDFEIEGVTVIDCYIVEGEEDEDEI